MVRAAQRIQIPNLDANFVAARNPDNNWLIDRFVENIDTLNQLAANLPKKALWDFRTAEEFILMPALIPEANRERKQLQLWWKDMLGQIQAFGLLPAWRLTEVAPR